MWSYLDANWLAKFFKDHAAGKPLNMDTAPKPDINKRSAIRSIFDGRFKYSRYFRNMQHNRPTTLEQIYHVNDVELFDLKNEPHEMNNLGLDQKKNAELIMAMNDKLNRLVDEEVGPDLGQHLPDIKDVNWAFERWDM